MDMGLLGLSKFLISMHPSTLLKAALDESNKMCRFCNLVIPKKNLNNNNKKNSKKQ